MKIAVLYVGELRTYQSAIHYFKQHVLLNDDYHVFSVIQSNGTTEYQQLFKDVIQTNLKKMVDFNKDDIDWNQIKEQLLDRMDVNEQWKSYLRNSGSMIEYYHLYLAYNLMVEYEKEHNLQYDFVIRIRVDTVIKTPFHFNWIHYTDEELSCIIDKIKTTHHIDTMISEQLLSVLMNTLLNENRIDFNKLRMCNMTTSLEFTQLLQNNTDAEFITNVNTYIKNKNFLIAFRENVCFVATRNVMEHVHLLGITYGKYVLDNNDIYKCNAETQLKTICNIHNIDYFSSVTEMEDSSLYSYDHHNYFDMSNNLIDNHYDFFIKRI